MIDFGLAQGAVAPALNMMMFKRCSAQRRGTASAAFYSSIDLGLGIGSIVVGVIAAGFNYYVVYLGAMTFALLALTIYLSGIAKNNFLKNIF